MRGLESTMAPAQARSIKLLLNDIQVTGSTVFSAVDFRELYAGLLGKTISLADVFDIAAQITTLYGKNGFLLSRVIVPPQELNKAGAVIRLHVVEGYIDRVIWPDEVKRYRDYFSHYARQITRERPITAATIERYLLLANDLPGLTFRSTLKASESNPGASTMILELESKVFDASLSLDNRGTDGSGPLQAYSFGTVSNLFRRHGSLSLGYVTAGPGDDQTTRPELHYLTGHLQSVLTPEGLTLNLRANGSLGEPGTAVLRQLEVETKSLNFTTELVRPLIRTRPKNLFGTVAFDFKNSESLLLNQTSTRDRLRIIRAELSFDRADERKGVNQLTLTAHQGIEGLGSTKNNNPTASRLNGKVDFFRTTIEASRLQTLTSKHQFFLAAHGQLTPDALLSSQECGYGGTSYGRGFDPSIITGDQCLLALAELRYNLMAQGPRGPRSLDYAQFFTFADYGKIWNKNAPLGTAREDDASSLGFGFRAGRAWLSGELMFSTTVDEPQSIIDQDDRRVFFRLTADR